MRPRVTSLPSRVERVLAVKSQSYEIVDAAVRNPVGTLRRTGCNEDVPDATRTRRQLGVIYLHGSLRSRTCYVARVGWIHGHMAGDRAVPPTASRAMAKQRLELRWYADWRWRVTSDGAGFALWCGPIAVYWWRRIDTVV